jgi:hypothetical protein
VTVSKEGCWWCKGSGLIYVPSFLPENASVIGALLCAYCTDEYLRVKLMGAKLPRSSARRYAVCPPCKGSNSTPQDRAARTGFGFLTSPGFEARTRLSGP